MSSCVRLAFPRPREGELLGHVQLGVRLVDELADEQLDAETRAELIHAIAAHHDLRSALTAEAAALYHANQLDAVAATRPTTPTGQADRASTAGTPAVAPTA